MKPSDLPTNLGTVTMIEVCADGPGAFPLAVDVGDEIEFDEGQAGGIVAAIRRTRTPVKAANPSAGKRLDDLVARGLPRVSWVARIDRANGAPRGLLVQTHEFVAAVNFPEKLSIQLAGDVMDQLKRKFGIRDLTEARRFLVDEMVICITDSRSRIVISAGRQPYMATAAGMQVFGRSVSLDLRKRFLTSNSGTSSAWFAERISAARVSRTHGYQLATAEFDICEAQSTAQELAARSELDEIVRNSGSYLGIWKEYNDLERRKLEERALDFGFVQYQSWRRVGDECRFKCSALDDDAQARLRDAIADREHLQAVEELSDPNEPQKLTRRYLCQPVAIESGEIATTSTSEMDPPKSGFLELAALGHVMLGRRERARDLIAGAKCPLLWLGLLIEGRGVPSVRHKRFSPLSASAKQAFRGEPTVAQLAAVDVALNTPDIAIIQGPPGTGKTRVIAALQSRLAELGEGDDGPFGETLLTSFQHDAVDTVAVASTALGIPASRVGNRFGRTADADATELWRRDLIQKLMATTSSTVVAPVHTVRKNLRRLLLAEQHSPSGSDSGSKVLRQAYSEAGPWLSEQTATRLLDTAHRLRQPVTAAQLPLEREIALNAVYGLPTTEESVRDDGAARARKALLALDHVSSEFVSALERHVLERLRDWDGASAIPSTNTLVELRAALLDRLRPGDTPPAHNLANVEVEEALLSALAEVEQAARSIPLDASVAVEDLIDELESDPDSVRDELLRYSSSLASTVQQSVASSMRRAKLSSTGTSDMDWPRFRTVIVDEAARCNPLDLMIPMSVAERRIVLVGDHRQLPHMLEPDVERELSDTAADETRQALGKSLFERLVMHVRELERKDGVKRYVRLDTQYRMPPSLGTFVNDSFYAPYGESFTNGMEEAQFAHGLDGPYARKSAAWKDIPIEAGAETGGRSKCRKAEARWIAEEVRRIGSHRPDLSIGIITFYGRQVEEINRELAKSGIVERDGDAWIPMPEWRVTSGRTTAEDRLRIGTVDSFQGKQFDVVFLSLVRSNRSLGSDTNSLRKRFGFLLIENRVCVAMSRQQRLLIAVGDSRMFADANVADLPGVRSLNSFHRFCGGPHGIRI